MPRGARDANEPGIIMALRAAGATVVQLEDQDREGVPDLLVGYRGETYLLEVKTERGKLDPGQVRWHREWRGRPVAVVRNAVEALLAIGATAARIPRESRVIAQTGR